MKKTERRDYQIAILGSLLFHIIILLLFLPGSLFRKEVVLKTYPVGVVELGRDNGQGGNPAAGVLAPNDTAPGKMKDDKVVAKSKVVPEVNPPQKEEPKSKVINSQPVKDNPPEIFKTKLASQPVSDSNVKPPQPTDTPNIPNSGNTSSGAGASGQDLGPPNDQTGGTGFGTGEGKVLRLGQAPPYPKNALNEGVEGRVSIRVLILKEGLLDQVLLLNSSNDSRLDKAALKAVTSWQYAAESQNYYIDLDFVFDLKDGVSIRFIHSATRP